MHEHLLRWYADDQFEKLMWAWKEACKTRELALMLSSVFMRRGKPRPAMEYLAWARELPAALLKAATVPMMEGQYAPLPQEPRVHLLVLVYNRIGYVETALRELAATDYRNYAVYLLDNASSDGSGAVAARAREMFPDHIPVELVSLPVNIGRPLGHNWLLSAYDHSQADFIAIADDDLLVVDPVWMRQMVNTFMQVPADLVGCKALYAGGLKTIQSADARLNQFSWQNFEMEDNRFTQDYGQFDYIAECTHVIGCLHMYRRSVFADVGQFDLRFSPSQYVDVDHHLRMLLTGKRIWYNGLIECRHACESGLEAIKDTVENGNSLGNLLKLRHKHDHAQIQALIAQKQVEREKQLDVGKQVLTAR